MFIEGIFLTNEIFSIAQTDNNFVCDNLDRWPLDKGDNGYVFMCVCWAVVLWDYYWLKLGWMWLVWHLNFMIDVQVTLWLHR